MNGDKKALIERALQEAAAGTGTDSTLALSLLLEVLRMRRSGGMVDPTLALLRTEFGDDVAAIELSDADLETLFIELDRLSRDQPFNSVLANLLTQPEDVRAVPVILRLLEKSVDESDPWCWQVREQLVDGLHPFRDRSDVRALLSQIVADHEDRVAPAAREVLSRSRAEKVVPPVPGT
jgi:HEAT repeat protein